ncbi:hypothetical protein AAG570_002899 [Ranatra chinensis]|uniref:DUF5641 domain-containing protein n=1 Tax=Ranatra chinensis TaxID=642074 RepID=A0ABD0Y7D5_9HEMI
MATDHANFKSFSKQVRPETHLAPGGRSLHLILHSTEEVDWKVGKLLRTTGGEGRGPKTLAPGGHPIEAAEQRVAPGKGGRLRGERSLILATAPSLKGTNRDRNGNFPGSSVEPTAHERPFWGLGAVRLTDPPPHHHTSRNDATPTPPRRHPSRRTDNPGRLLTPS